MARKNKRINALDLFSGIGGFALGIEKTGIKHEWLGFSEIDKYASELYKRRFPNAKELGSVENISYESLKGQKIDLLTGGFPCQAFSIAGKRQGFEDTRGTLFFEIARILEDYIKNGKPIPCILLENVKGLLSHDNKRTFITIYKILADLNYTLECQVVNTRWFLPQNRERIFIFGRYNGRRSGRKVFPIGKNGIKVGFEGLNQIGIIGSKNSEALRVYDTTCSRTIKSGGGMGAKTGLYDVTFKTYGIIPESDKPKGNWLPRERVLESNNGLSRAISTSQSQHPYYTDKTRIRRLTPVECERLQGFPDNWTEGQSDAQRYKQCGNAVSVPVIEAIIRKIYDL